MSARPDHRAMERGHREPDTSWLAFRPDLAAALKWTPDPSTPGRWHTARGDLAVESVWWVNGWWTRWTISSYDTDAEGHTVILTPAGFDDISTKFGQTTTSWKLTRHENIEPATGQTAATRTHMLTDAEVTLSPTGSQQALGPLSDAAVRHCCTWCSSNVLGAAANEGDAGQRDRFTVCTGGCCRLLGVCLTVYSCPQSGACFTDAVRCALSHPTRSGPRLWEVTPRLIDDGIVQ